MWQNIFENSLAQKMYLWELLVYYAICVFLLLGLSIIHHYSNYNISTRCAKHGRSQDVLSALFCCVFFFLCLSWWHS